MNVDTSSWKAAAMRRGLVWPVGLVGLGSGVINLLMVMHPHFPPKGSVFEELFPLEFFRLSRFLTLLIGFALIITSFALLRRKRRAWWTATVLTCVVIPFHLAQGLDWRGAAFAGIFLLLLLAARPAFVVRSSLPDLRPALLRVVGAALLAIAYGTAGFWLIERHHFGKDFNVFAAIHQALLHLTLVGDPWLQPQTRYARWFLDSLDLTTVVGILFAGLSLYRPVIHRFRELPNERRRAAAIVARHGRSSLDFFKYWSDKSFFFSGDGGAFLAYRVGGRHAIVLGDPVGPEASLEPLVRSFRDFCRENDWGLAFHQTLPDFLPIYERLGLHRLKISDAAIVDLTVFDLEGRKRKEFRNVISRLDRQGITYARHEPPLDVRLLRELKSISDEWLRLPGRRERQFTLGQFRYEYVRSTPVAVVGDEGGRILAFANLIPSYVPGEATIDLMRRRIEIPNGAMDYLFVKLLLQLKESGFTRFDLGMAPMSGFTKEESATPEERALHAFFRHLSFLFSFTGMRAYKAKFASTWEPRFLIHQGILNLPAVAIAIARVSELHGHKEEEDVSIPMEEPPVEEEVTEESS